MQTSNITNVSDRILKFESYGRNPEGFYWLDGVHHAEYQTPQMDLKGFLKQDVDELLEKQKGFCLACVKSRGRSARRKAIVVLRKKRLGALALPIFILETQSRLRVCQYSNGSEPGCRFD